MTEMSKESDADIIPLDDGPTDPVDVSDIGELEPLTADQANPHLPASCDGWHDGDTSSRERRYAAAEAAFETGRFVAVETNRDAKIWYCDGDGLWHPEGRRKLGEWMRPAFGPGYSEGALDAVVEHLRRINPIASDTMGLGERAVVCQSGRLDLDDREVRPLRPDDYATCRVPVRYDDTADCPAIMRFMEETFGHYGDEREDIIRTLFEFLGYCLLPGCKYQKALFVFGPPRTGKSVLLDLIQTFLGEANTTDVALQQLANNRFAPANLQGSIANIRADLSSNAVKYAGRIKELVAGDRIHAERKYEQGFSFQPNTKYVFSANQAPEGEFDDAFYRRFITLEATNQLDPDECDPNLIDKLTTDEELSGAFNRAITGLERLEDQGRFSYEPTPTTTRQIWEGFGDQVARFVADRLDVTGDSTDFIPKADLYDEFTQFADNPMTQQKFTTELKARPGVEDGRNKVGGKSVRTYRGVQLQPNG